MVSDQALIQAIDPTEESVATRIVAIQRAAYAVEAELMGFDGIPPLHELVIEVQAREDLIWLAAFTNDTIVGIVAWFDHGDSVEIDRLAVDPDWSRHGYGRQLVRAVPQAPVIDVSTGVAELSRSNVVRERRLCIGKHDRSRAWRLHQSIPTPPRHG